MLHQETIVSAEMKRLFNEDNQKCVINVLQHFGCHDYLKQIKSRLEQDNNVVVSRYLDVALAPLFKNLHNNRDKNKDSKEYLANFFSLCFRGDLSITVLKNAWNQLSHDEYYDYFFAPFPLPLFSFCKSPAGPLELPIQFTNLPALKFLQEVYEKKWLPDHSYDAYFTSQLVFVTEMVTSIPSFKWWRDACITHAGTKNNNAGFASKMLPYYSQEKTGPNHYSCTWESISLLDLFARLGEKRITKFPLADLSYAEKTIISTLFSLVKEQGEDGEFAVLKIKIYELADQNKRLTDKQYAERMQIIEAFNPECDVQSESSSEDEPVIPFVINQHDETITPDTIIIDALPPQLSLFAPTHVNDLSKLYPEYEAILQNLNANPLDNAIELFNQYCRQGYFRNHAKIVDAFLKSFNPIGHTLSDFLTSLKTALVDAGEYIKPAHEGGSLAKRIDFIQKKYDLNIINLDDFNTALPKKKTSGFW
jgi:hypothetical protein